MRERLAEGEHELMRIVDPPSEDDRHHIGDRLRLDLAGLDDRHATRLVMGDQFVRPGAQADEREVVAGQNEHVLGQRRFQLFERAQIEAERVAASGSIASTLTLGEILART